MTPSHKKKCRHREYENIIMPDDQLESKIEQIQNRVNVNINQYDTQKQNLTSELNCSFEAKVNSKNDSSCQHNKHKPLRFIDTSMIGYSSQKALDTYQKQSQQWDSIIINLDSKVSNKIQAKNRKTFKIPKKKEKSMGLMSKERCIQEQMEVVERRSIEGLSAEKYNWDRPWKQTLRSTYHPDA